MLTQEIKDLIVQDVKELGSIERLGGTLLQHEEEKQPQVSPRKIENEERPNLEWSNLLIKKSVDRSSSGDSFGLPPSSVESVDPVEVDGMN